MIKRFSLKTIKFYQKFISPSLGNHCRFYPSCSQYCRLAIRKHGIGKGIFLGMKRILRCQPWNQGGVDLP